MLLLQPSASPVTDPILTAQPSDDWQLLDEKVASFAQSAAAREQQVLSSAMADLQQQEGRLQEAQQKGQPSAAQLQLGNQKKAATDAASLRVAAMKRIEAARKYSASKPVEQPSGVASTPPAVSSPASPSAQPEGPAEWVQSSVGSAAQVHRCPPPFNRLPIGSVLLLLQRRLHAARKVD